MKKTKVSDRPILAQNIIRRRNILGWSQSKLAEQVGVHVNTIKQIELGESEPSPANRDAIAQALGISVADLYTTPREPTAAKRSSKTDEIQSMEKVLGRRLGDLEPEELELIGIFRQARRAIRRELIDHLKRLILADQANQSTAG